MSLTLKNQAGTNVTYSVLRDSSSGTQLTKSYFGPSNTDILKDQVVVKSTDPKRTADSYGVRRSSVAYYLSKAISDPNAASATKDMKIEVSVSVPIGAAAQSFSAADLLEAAARVQEFITNETYIQNVFLTGVSPD